MFLPNLKQPYPRSWSKMPVPMPRYMLSLALLQSTCSSRTRPESSQLHLLPNKSYLSGARCQLWEPQMSRKFDPACCGEPQTDTEDFLQPQTCRRNHSDLWWLQNLGEFQPHQMHYSA